MADNTIELKTITKFWNFRKNLYRVLGFRLSEPISARTVLWTGAIAVPLWAVLWIFGIGFKSWGMTWHFVVPFAIVLFGLRAMSHGQRPVDVVRSWTLLARRVVGLKVMLAMFPIIYFGSRALIHGKILGILVTAILIAYVWPRRKPKENRPTRINSRVRIPNSEIPEHS